MLDLNSSQLLLDAQLADRRRELAALNQRSGVRIRHHVDLRAALADVLAHLAMHIDRRAAGAVVARHVHAAGRN